MEEGFSHPFLILSLFWKFNKKQNKKQFKKKWRRGWLTGFPAKRDRQVQGEWSQRASWSTGFCSQDAVSQYLFNNNNNKKATLHFSQRSQLAKYSGNSSRKQIIIQGPPKNKQVLRDVRGVRPSLSQLEQVKPNKDAQRATCLQEEWGRCLKVLMIWLPWKQ